MPCHSGGLNTGKYIWHTRQVQISKLACMTLCDDKGLTLVMTFLKHNCMHKNSLLDKAVNLSTVCWGMKCS